ncbi:pentatricopeptide repeat-containing protein At2g17210 [Rosa rugosa]|uniref:pentatricopeptide repeat-containing protein At2g17210 n=1 Tax=Rosa rugosa TaxID=74645 RepID=UPI002B40AABA|nr:pentatricopeptide repeat-containing protein At2g17210 [Rosa rugosa]XP_062024973.1 pentatricopeptide repeat-containing protein At2g17210 [Rosa rugosa]XP_062024974.1 pentatricopeptide repeat-containing protein At2g17210 [Rosa rugosa]XP_062024975.1 pentatricopeptide repeat-containing protein At2g17210 [Rosa rugosa]XP_062024976.1 pentatricopeptide repeat-containing protein At2g17210 [Rosa rugosa]XP_062024977.1 pentatricopeptide repeat-containing protein At2g17210 [Rosa rugosa]XP_062024978.1 pe
MRVPSSTNLCNWHLKLKDLSSNGKWVELLCHYHQVNKAGLHPTHYSVFPPILKACSNLLSYSYGKSIHGWLIKTGCDSCTSIANSTMDFYIKTRDPDSALGVFNSVRWRDQVSWNIMVYGSLDLGNLEQGLWWFNKARVSVCGFQPNTSTLVLVIQACRRLRDKYEGLKVHGYVIRGGFCYISSVQNSLLSLYAEDDDMESAHKLFDEMSERDVISWSVMIGGHVHCVEAEIGMKMFRKMVCELGVEPDGVTAVSVLKGCASLRDLTMGTSLHGLVIYRGLDSDLFVGNSLIDMYAKCSDADSAFKVFEELPQRNRVSWNSMLSAFVHNERYMDALSLFYSMGKEGINADEVTLVNILQICKHLRLVDCKSVHCVTIRWGFESNELLLNSLIDAYAKCNCIELAWKLFDRMKKRDVVSWSTMIAGFTHCGRPDQAIAVFGEMTRLQVQDDQKPNEITLINLLEACSVSAELKWAKGAHGIAIRRGLSTADQVAVGTATVDMYSKCGAIGESRKVFDQISEKNIVSWSAMIAAYGMNGLAHEALALVEEMKLYGAKPNAVTTLSMLSACSHGGLVEEGLSLFNSLVQVYGIEPRLEHYACVVDMLGRAGKLHMAMDFIKNIPEGLKVTGENAAWSALLSACRSYGNSDVGAVAASHVLELEPESSTGYLLASSIYAAGGLWVDAASIRRMVKEKEVKVVAGYSLVYVDNKACRFVAGDIDCHSLAAGEMHSTVELLHACMKTEKRNAGNFDIID